MVVGAVALGIGFLSAPTTVEEAKAMVADAHGHGGHGGHGDHDAHADDHAVAHKDEAHHSDHTTTMPMTITTRTMRLMLIAIATMLMVEDMVIATINISCISCKTAHGLPPM